MSDHRKLGDDDFVEQV